MIKNKNCMMKPGHPRTCSTIEAQTAVSAATRFPVFVLVFILLGAVSAGIWVKYGKHGTETSLAGRELSDNTLAVLHQLNVPVEIRFYSVLPPGSAPETLQAFSGRVDQLLSKFQNANDAKIHVTRNSSTTGSNADAASADGIRPFNLDKGDACFLGIAVVCGGRKESLSQLQPEWEPALEFDLARVIARVTATQSPATVHTTVPVSPEVTNAVTQLIPDLSGTTLEDGGRMLREAALKEFTAAGTEMEEKLKAAQQRLVEAQNGQSEAEQQAAMKNLQEVQLEQGEKYKQIAARLQSQNWLSSSR